MTAVETQPVTAEQAQAETAAAAKQAGLFQELEQKPLALVSADTLAQSLVPNDALATAYAAQGIWGPKPEILVKFLMAEELKIPKMTALQKLFVFRTKDGRVNAGMFADLMRALFLSRCPGASMAITRLDAGGCTIVASRNGVQPREYTYTEEDAKRAGNAAKDTYRGHPTRMFLARASSLMVNAIASDVLMGCTLTPEEVGDVAEINEAREETQKALADYLAKQTPKHQGPPDKTPTQTPANIPGAKSVDPVAEGRAAFKAAVTALCARDLGGLVPTDTDVVSLWTVAVRLSGLKDRKAVSAWISEHGRIGAVEGANGEVTALTLEAAK